MNPFPSNSRAVLSLPPLGAALVAVTGCLGLSACGTVVAVADTAGTMVVTTVKAGVEVAGAAVDVAASGVKAVAGSSDKK